MFCVCHNIVPKAADKYLFQIPGAFLSSFSDNIAGNNDTLKENVTKAGSFLFTQQEELEEKSIKQCKAGIMLWHAQYSSLYMSF